MKNTILALLAALLGLASCTKDRTTDERDDVLLEDHSFEFSARAEHDGEMRGTRLTLTLVKGDPEQQFSLSCRMDDNDFVLKDTEGEEFPEGSLLELQDGSAVFIIRDEDLMRGSHSLSMDIRTDRWEQRIETQVTVDYQPFRFRHTVSTAARESSELTLELLRGASDAEYAVCCSIAGEYGYTKKWKVSFAEEGRCVLALPLVRPGEYRLTVRISDGREEQVIEETVTEIIREKYRTMRFIVTETPQGSWSLVVPKNPYRVEFEFSSKLTVKGSCEYDDVRSDRDGDWPWPRTAYSEESDECEPYRGIYSDETLPVHDYDAVLAAIRASTEASAHFSEDTDEWGNRTLYVSGYSYISHEPYAMSLEMTMKVTDPVEGVSATIRHDLIPGLPEQDIRLNGSTFEYQKEIECPIQADEKRQ